MKRMMLAAILAAAATGASAGDFDRGAVLSMSCAACHGTDGVSPGVMPTLNGQSRAFINNRMIAFRSGKRLSTVMGRIAKGYSDEEIAAIAQHLSRLKQE
jgi:sulfide dehydrogenase cytochrome subunit